MPKTPKPKPYTEEKFKKEADKYIKGYLGGFDQGEMNEFLKRSVQKVEDSGVMSSDEAKDFIKERASYLKDFIQNNPGETLPQLNEKSKKTGDPFLDKLMFLPNTLDKVAEKIAPMLGYADGGRIGYSEGSDYFDEQKTNVKGKKTTGPMPGGKTPQIPEEEFLKYQQFKENKIVPVSSDSKPEYGTKEYFKQNLDNLNLEQFIEKPFLLNPFSIGLIEDRLNSFEKAGGDSSKYRNLYENIKQENKKYFQSLSEAEQKAYIDRHRKSLEKDIGLGILPGQEELGILDLKKEKGIPQPKKDPFDIEGFKKYRMDVATGGRIGFELGSLDPDTLALSERVKEIMDAGDVDFGIAFKQALRELIAESKD